MVSRRILVFLELPDCSISNLSTNIFCPRHDVEQSMRAHRQPSRGHVRYFAAGNEVAADPSSDMVDTFVSPLMESMSARSACLFQCRTRVVQAHSSVSSSTPPHEDKQLRLHGDDFL